MISERKIKERLIDICAGAGAEWDDEFQYFKYEDDALSVTGRIITACEFAENHGCEVFYHEHDQLQAHIAL